MKNNIMRNCLALTLISGFALPLRAEEPAPLSLESAIAEAQAHNPDIARSEAASREASWRRLEAISGYLPSVGLVAGDVLTTKYTMMGIHFGPQTLEMPAAAPAQTIDIGASWTFFDGLKTWQIYRAAVAGYEAAKADLVWSRFILERQVKSRWYRLLASQMLEGVAKENVLTLESHLDVAKAGMQNGVSTQFDILRIEAQLEEARADETLTADDVAQARRALAEILGREGDSIALDGSLPIPDDAIIPPESECKIAGRADLYSLNQRVESAQQAGKAALTSVWCPSISLFANEDLYKFKAFNPMIVPDSEFKSAYTVGVRLRWDILSGGAGLAKERQAAAKAEQARQEAKARILHASNETVTWRRRYLYNTTLYRARTRSQEKSAESVRIAIAGVKAGVRTNSEELDAELDLFRAKAGVFRAQADAADAMLNLEMAIGRSLNTGKR